MIIAGIDITDGTVLQLMGIAAVGGMINQQVKNLAEKVKKLENTPERLAKIETTLSTLTGQSEKNKNEKTD